MTDDKTYEYDHTWLASEPVFQKHPEYAREYTLLQFARIVAAGDALHPQMLLHAIEYERAYADWTCTQILWPNLLRIIRTVLECGPGHHYVPPMELWREDNDLVYRSCYQSEYRLLNIFSDSEDEIIGIRIRMSSSLPAWKADEGNRHSDDIRARIQMRLEHTDLSEEEKSSFVNAVPDNISVEED